MTPGFYLHLSLSETFQRNLFLRKSFFLFTQVSDGSFVLHRDRLLSSWARRSYGDVQREVAAAQISCVACGWISHAAC